MVSYYKRVVQLDGLTVDIDVSFSIKHFYNNREFTLQFAAIRNILYAPTKALCFSEPTETNRPVSEQFYPSDEQPEHRKLAYGL